MYISHRHDDGHSESEIFVFCDGIYKIETGGKRLIGHRDIGAQFTNRYEPNYTYPIILTLEYREAAEFEKSYNRLKHMQAVLLEENREYYEENKIKLI